MNKIEISADLNRSLRALIFGWNELYPILNEKYISLNLQLRSPKHPLYWSSFYVSVQLELCTLDEESL